MFAAPVANVPRASNLLTYLFRLIKPKYSVKYQKKAPSELCVCEEEREREREQGYLCRGGTLSMVLRLPRVDTTLKLSVQSQETWR